VAPAGTPEQAVRKLNAVFNSVLKQPDIAETMAADGTQPLVLSPEQFAELIRGDTAVWGDAIRRLDIKLD